MPDKLAESLHAPTDAITRWLVANGHRYRWGKCDCVNFVEYALRLQGRAIPLRPGWCSDSHGRSVAQAKDRHGSMQGAYLDGFERAGLRRIRLPRDGFPFVSVEGRDVEFRALEFVTWRQRQRLAVATSFQIDTRQVGAVIGVRVGTLNVVFAQDGIYHLQDHDLEAGFVL